jgi:hypothetical protein
MSDPHHRIAIGTTEWLPLRELSEKQEKQLSLPAVVKVMREDLQSTTRLHVVLPRIATHRNIPLFTAGIDKDITFSLCYSR